MIKILLPIIFILSNTICAATVFFGKLVCKETSQPVEFANIGIIGKDVGAITAADGQFSIELDDKYNNDELRISCIGYSSLSMTVKEFKVLTSGGAAIFMHQRVDQLREVVIGTSKKQKHKHLGITTNNGMIIATFDSCARGNEAGVLMQIQKRPTYIDSVQINLSCASDSIFFRVNIYEQTDTTFTNILTKPIVVALSSAAIKKGKVRIDLSQKHIVVTKDFMVSFELLRDLGRQKLFFPAALFVNNGYVRKASQGAWEKSPGYGIAISAFVRY